MNYLRWLFLTTFYLICISVAELKFSFFSYMAYNDLSYISYVIWFIFAVGLVWSFICSLEKEPNMSKFDKFSLLATTLGLLGTFVGMAQGLASEDFMTLDINDKQSILSVLGGTTKNMGTALNTTIVGLLTYVMLHFYTLFFNCKKEK
jgi:hypothetical protein